MDETVFHFINTSLTNMAFDAFFPGFTNFHHTLWFSLGVVPLAVAIVFWAGRWWGVLAVAIAALVTVVADELSSHLLKPFFFRTRPYDAGFDVILRIARPSGTSFPSSHTLDVFCLATFLSMFFPRARILFFTIACLMGFSRVYDGVHYPGDVLGGVLLGCAFGGACALIVSRLIPRLRLLRTS